VQLTRCFSAVAELLVDVGLRVGLRISSINIDLCDTFSRHAESINQSIKRVLFFNVAAYQLTAKPTGTILQVYNEHKVKTNSGETSGQA